jgi:hypothetical protein
VVGVAAPTLWDHAGGDAVAVADSLPPGIPRFGDASGRAGTILTFCVARRRPRHSRIGVDDLMPNSDAQNQEWALGDHSSNKKPSDLEGFSESG